MPIAAVALDVPVGQLFHYLTDKPLGMGQRVSVPLGRRQLVGIVVGQLDASHLPSKQLRPVTAILDDAPALPAEWMRLTEFASRYYQRALGEVMLAALPPRLKQSQRFRHRPAYAITAQGRDLMRSTRSAVARSVLLYLAERGPAPRAVLVGLAPTADRILARLVAGQAVVETSIEPALERGSFRDDRVPTPAQAEAIGALRGALGRDGVFVLFGVTGSGKTEVYLHVIAEALRRGEQSLVLVPEIHLTPQLEQQFAGRFPGVSVAVLHSGRPANERAEAWIAAQTGRAAIVLGTRLAVFTPFKRLGLIVVDEEHDASFKQQEGARYSARDIAVYRAHAAGIPVLLGSATPSLETWSNARSGRYRLLALPDRATPGAAPPRIGLVDTRKDIVEHGLTRTLTAAIEARLARGEQSLVFLNRRGYAPVLACGACGWVADCPRCSTHAAIHLKERCLRCHHCGHEAAIPRQCPECGNVDLHPFGRGTERLEAVLAERFPEARLARIDSDSMRFRGEWERMHASIHARHVDIMVGTQMLAKGHDFPALTLVGVVNADAALFAVDYRAPERLFAQLLQVAGRAGRAALPGEVLIQTRYPEHPLYRALTQGDYASFADGQLQERGRARFPPAVAEAVLRAEARTREAALAFLNRAASNLPKEAEQVSVFDPVPMSLPRLAGWERAHVLVQARARGSLQRFLTAWRGQLEAARTPAGVRWHFDVDPTEF